MYCIYTTYIVLYIQGSPQDFIKAVGSSHSAVFIRYFNNKLLEGCCMPSSVTIHIRKC